MGKTNKPEINSWLTRGMFNVLTRMRESELDESDDSHFGEFVYGKGGGWWIGFRRVGNGRRICNMLLDLCLVTCNSRDLSADYQVYMLTEDGRRVLTDVNYTPSIVFIRRGCPKCKSASVIIIGDVLECRDCKLEQDMRKS